MRITLTCAAHSWAFDQQGVVALFQCLTREFCPIPRVFWQSAFQRTRAAGFRIEENQAGGKLFVRLTMQTLPGHREKEKNYCYAYK